MICSACWSKIGLSFKSAQRFKRWNARRCILFHLEFIKFYTIWSTCSYIFLTSMCWNGKNHCRLNQWLWVWVLAGADLSDRNFCRNRTNVRFSTGRNTNTVRGYIILLKKKKVCLGKRRKWNLFPSKRKKNQICFHTSTIFGQLSEVMNQYLELYHVSHTILFIW